MVSNPNAEHAETRAEEKTLEKDKALEEPQENHLSALVIESPARPAMSRPWLAARTDKRVADKTTKLPRSSSLTDSQRSTTCACRAVTKAGQNREHETCGAFHEEKTGTLNETRMAFVARFRRYVSGR